MEDAMNKCTASAFQSSEIVHCLKFLRDAYCSERISAAHKAVVKADLNRAIDSVLHANAEFCQGGSGGRTATYKKRWMSIEIIVGIMEFPAVSERSLAAVVDQLYLMRGNYHKKLGEKTVPSRGEVLNETERAIADVIRADRAFHIALALKEQQQRREAEQAQGATHNEIGRASCR